MVRNKTSKRVILKLKLLFNTHHWCGCLEQRDADAARERCASWAPRPHRRRSRDAACPLPTCAQPEVDDDGHRNRKQVPGDVVVCRHGERREYCFKRRRENIRDFLKSKKRTRENKYRQKRHKKLIMLQ